MLKRLIWLAFGVLALVALGLGAFWYVAEPRRPGPFYAWDYALPFAPGTLLRTEPLTEPQSRAVPEGAQGWRILYVTSRPDGTPATATAVVVAPAGGGWGPLPLVAYAHGTTGVAAGCAPSLFDNPFPYVPAYPQLLDRGLAYVGTDYAGLGTAGAHFYLVGQDAGRAVLDSIRAARQMDAADLTGPVLLWGHSQGGHSALWAGQIAADYAPEIAIAGIAALSPAGDLPNLVRRLDAPVFGTIIAAYMMAGYDAAYPGLDPWDWASDLVRPLMRDIARRCLEMPDALLSIAETRLIDPATMFDRDPASGVLGDRLAENTARGPFPAPVLIGQGAADPLVTPDVQAAYAASLCAAGEPVEYRSYPGEDHLSVVSGASPMIGELLDWSEARLRGLPPAPGC